MAEGGQSDMRLGLDPLALESFGLALEHTVSYGINAGTSEVGFASSCEGEVQGVGPKGHRKAQIRSIRPIQLLQLLQLTHRARAIG